MSKNGLFPPVIGLCVLYTPDPYCGAFADGRSLFPYPNCCKPTQATAPATPPAGPPKNVPTGPAIDDNNFVFLRNYLLGSLFYLQ